MTTLQDQDFIAKRNVHYRRGVESLGKAPGIRGFCSVDVTGRLCVPCAVVGHRRAADILNEVGTPECYPHYEFSVLAASKRREVIATWRDDGSACGILTLIAEFRASNPGWFDRVRVSAGAS